MGKASDVLRNKMELRSAPDLTANPRKDCGYTDSEIVAAPDVAYEDEASGPVPAPGGPAAAPIPSIVDDQLIKEMRQHGLTVRLVEGWRSRGRGGTFNPRGVVAHHTASNKASGPSPALGIVTHGRSDLPGPLAQFHLGRNAVVSVVAAGRANHAGEGGPHKGIPKDSGNAYLIGIEAENNGIGETWPDDVRRAYAALCAVLLRRMRRSAYMTIGHKEWTSRKIDPFGINMDNFRDRVTANITEQKRRR